MVSTAFATLLRDEGTLGVAGVGAGECDQRVEDFEDFVFLGLRELLREFSGGDGAIGGGEQRLHGFGAVGEGLGPSSLLGFGGRLRFALGGGRVVGEAELGLLGAGEKRLCIPDAASGCGPWLLRRRERR